MLTKEEEILVQAADWDADAADDILLGMRDGRLCISADALLMLHREPRFEIVALVDDRRGPNAVYEVFLQLFGTTQEETLQTIDLCYQISKDIAQFLP